jgi:hypothetical protein
MAQLSSVELKDVCVHTCQRIANNLGDACQLVDDPAQRAHLTFQLALAMFEIAADATKIAFHAETGERVPDQIVQLGLLKQMLEHAGFKEMA